MCPDSASPAAPDDGSPAPLAAPRRRGLGRLLPRRLALRLILGTTLLVACGHLVSTLVVMGLLERRWLGEKVLTADQLSTSLTTATRHLMRADRKDDAYAMMRTIGEAQGVVRIHIYNRTGRLAFRTDEGPQKDAGLDSPVCRVCHAQAPPRSEAPAQDRARFGRGSSGRRELSIVTAIANEPGCSTAECHTRPSGARVLGVLDLAVDLSGLDAQLASLRGPAFLVTTCGILLVAAFLYGFVHRMVARPIDRLLEGTRAVARMEMGDPVRIPSTAELAELATSFNSMQARLREAIALNARTLGEAEGRAERRRLELQATRERLVASDRLASLGKLAASVAHEVNNPISAVLTLSMYLQRILTDAGVPPDRLPAFRRHLQQIADETARAGRIVTDLLSFSRRSAPRRSPSDLNLVVQQTLDLVRSRAADARVEIRTELDPALPLVPCDAGQVQQVLLNLVINAIEALKDGGHVVVRSGREAATESAVLQVEDDGPGISPEHVVRIFDPFFSTKAEAKGVGLGLSVAYGIAEAHGGRLSVHSEVGRGAVFTLRLPVHPAPSPPEDSA